MAASLSKANFAVMEWHSVIKMDSLSSYVIASLENALADWALLNTAPIIVLKRLEGGLTNHSFLVACNDRLMVLRINAENSQALDIDRNSEKHIIQLAAQQYIAPPLVCFDLNKTDPNITNPKITYPVKNYQLMEYVEGKSLQPIDLQCELMIARVAQLLKATHSLPIAAKVIDWRQKIQWYWSAIHSEHSFYEGLKMADDAVQVYLGYALENNSPSGVCHHDFNPANIIKTVDGKLMLIDWEYAAVGNPYFDLVSIIEAGQLQWPQSQQLLRHYFGQEPSDEQCRQLQYWTIIYYYIFLLWLAVQCTSDVEGVSLDDFQAKKACFLKLVDEANQAN